MPNPRIVSPLDPTGLLLGDTVYGDLTLPKSAAVYKQGTVLGVGGVRASKSVPGCYVVPIDIDASAGAQPARVIIAGKVRGSRLIFDGATTLNSVIEETKLDQREHLRRVHIVAVDTHTQFHHEDNP